jgi:hypothetical protein
MMRATMTAIALTVAAASLLAQNPRPSEVPSGPVTREGWWVRVNPANEADNISWRFGAARNRLGTPLRWWKDETQGEFDLPAAQRNVKVLHVAALGVPFKAQVSFCVFFHDHGAALIEFANERNADIDQDQQEAACVP